MQIPDGRMVFVNEGMINLYNGATFTYLHMHENFSYPLPAYRGLHRLYLENPEHLWMKRYGQLMLFNILRERNEANLDSIFRSLGINSPLSDFFMDADNNLWFLTFSGDIYLKKHNANAASFFINLKKISDSDPITDISSYDNSVFFFLKSGIVLAYDIDKRQQVYRGNSLERQNAVDYLGTTYVIRGDKRFYVLRNGNRGILMTFDIPSRTWRRVLEVPYTLNTLSIGPKGKVVVSVSSGVWTMNSDFSNLRYFPSLQLADGRTINTEISTATYDNQGGLWLGTLNKGLLYYNPESYRLAQVNRVSFPTHEKKELIITSFLELSPAKEILVGTNHGIFIYDPTLKNIRKWDAMPDNINCFSILKDGKDVVWLSCDKGLFRYSRDRCQKMGTTAWKKIIEDGNGGYIAINEQDQLFYIDPNTGRATPMIMNISGSKSRAYASDVVCRGNNLYGINPTCIFQYNVLSKKFIFIEFKKNKAFHQLNNYHINCIALDACNRLWFGTQDGLNIWNFSNNSLTELHSEDGIVNNDVKAIIFDDHRDAWVTTAYGISKIEIKAPENKIHFTNFTKTDGVIAEKFNKRACLKLFNGQILMGGIDGFNLLDPSKHIANLPLKPIFYDLNVQGISIKPGIKYKNTPILDRSITAGGLITLNYRQNFFTIHFSGLNYANPSRTVYRYTLWGANDAWHETEPVNGVGTATYTNLDPGKYRLCVRVSGDGERWSSRESSLEIVITTPWWKTLPMMVIYWITGLAFLSGTWLYFNKRRKTKQKLLQEKRLNEMKFTFFTNISHELRTPLTLILTPLGIILKDLDNLQLKTQLRGVYNNAAHLLSMVNQLLDFRRLQTDKEHLHLTICDLSESIRLLSEPFKELAETKGIRFQIDTPGYLWLYLDNEKLEIIINNLLSNTLKFTPGGGTVKIEVNHGIFPDTAKEAAVIIIQDSGKGIAAADILHIFNRFYQGSNHFPGEMKGSGIGLNLVQEYVHLHGGLIDVKSTVGQGATFFVYLPFTRPIANENTADAFNEQEEVNKQTAKVLIAEDNIELRHLIAGQLRLYYQVIETCDGKQALSRITTDVPDLVVSDLMMPGMNGLELCQAIKSNIHTSHLPFILLTAKGSEHAHFEGYHVNADAYITKPFNMELLLLQVKNLLEIQEKRKAVFKNSIAIPLHLASASEIDEKFIKKLLECIERKLADENYSVEDLSNDMNMERSGLYRKVVAVTGQVPSLFIRTIRLEKAAQFLLLRQDPIAKIAEMTGFSSSAYFSKCFKDEFGVKPSEYYASYSNTVQ